MNRKQSTRQRWKAIFAGFAVLMLAAVGGGGYYVYKKAEQPLEFRQGVYQHFSQITTWLSSRKGTLSDGVSKQVEKVKRLSRVEPQEDQPVHFEFYSALPAMQVTQPVELASEEAAQKEVKQVVSKEPKPATIAEAPVLKSLAGKSLFLDPAELDRDFAKKTPQKGFVIQVGTFNSAAAADSLSDSLKGKEYHAEVIRVYIGDRKFYRVQVGPYISREKLRQAELDLKNQGISGIVRTVQVG